VIEYDRRLRRPYWKAVRAKGLYQDGKGRKRRLQENRFRDGRCYRRAPKQPPIGGEKTKNQGRCRLRCRIAATVLQNSLSRSRNRSLPTGMSSSEVSISFKASKFSFLAHSIIFSAIIFRSLSGHNSSPASLESCDHTFRILPENGRQPLFPDVVTVSWPCLTPLKLRIRSARLLTSPLRPFNGGGPGGRG